MSKLFLCHYSEIGLKKGNRNYFERVLETNMRKSLARELPGSKFSIRKEHKRFLIKYDETVPDERVKSALEKVFGLANFSPVSAVEADPEKIIQSALNLIKDKTFSTFAVRSKRADKSFPLTSQELNVEVGAKIVEALGKQVDLTRPELTCHIEVMPDQALIYVDRFKGAGGLPVSSSGKVLVLLSGGFDSPVASYLALKRGAKCSFIHFHSYPYTNKFSQEKVIELARVLNQFQFNAKLYMVPFAETQEEIVFNCPDKLRVILYRRFMMRIAERLAKKEGLKAVVTGEALGQVASQTLENLGAIEQAITLPVLRPLIGLDKEEIIAIARKIGTYEISSKPHDDACTRFMPRKPETRAKLHEVLEAEKALDVEGLVNKVMEKIEVLEI
ncbi:MAG TPA: tRNA 4-thiouridine(8) synthase ThiI [Caldithrix abyssi]|uniref:Probable tRNA sulfurtransferase n=1 Tax=Caldithrix abyssi TaxID=187145 RepID=A0A7V5H4L0_CALAY|nr:tRNA 4-thiouridine(8) synthase ThiI [Caldithrix abyssi]